MQLHDATMSVRFLHPFGAVLEGEGISTSRLLEAAGITTETYRSPERQVSYEAAGRFFAAAERSSTFAALGLEAACRLDLAKFQLLEYLAASSADVRTALEALVNHQAIFGNRKVLSLEDVATGSLLRFEPSDGTPRCFVEYVVGALALASVRAGPTRRGASADGQVWFAYEAPSARQAYRDFFGQEPVFDAGAHGIFVPLAQLERPMMRANVELRELLARELAAARQESESSPSTGERLRRLLAQSLEGSPLSMANAARRMYMSASTLKRRLTQEGQTYSSVLDQLRRQRAAQLLRDPALSVAEVAHLTGYADVTAFDKAFRRWTGQSPSQHRKSR